MNKNTISEKSIAEREERGSAGQHQGAAMKKGWETETLGELCDIRSGSTPSKGNPAFWDKGVIPWFTIDDMREQGRKISSTHQKITQAALSETSVKLLPEDSVLLCCTASVGEFAITRIPLATNQQFNGLVVKNKNQLDPNFLFHYASTLKDELLGLSGKTTINFIPISRLRDVAIPVPPLAEQQRIVGLLDEAFEGIAIAKANAEKNLQNARALFESHLQSVFTQRGKGWVENKLKSITTKIGSGATPRGGEESYKAEGISLIRSLNVHDLGFKYAKLAFLDDSQADELSNVEVMPRDVLLNITGASVARCTIVPEDVLPARVNQHVSIIRPIADKLDADFLHYLLISKPYKDQLLKTGEEGGSTRQAITKAQIQEFTVEYPVTLKEQKTIVAKLDAIIAETQRLANLYQQKLSALDSLKKSLLHQAFTGQL